MALHGNISNYKNLSGSVFTATSLDGSLSNPISDGLSAYEVAVKNGFQGTEKEWLNSLKPVKGVDYWTKEDIEQLKKEIISEILKEQEGVKWI